MKGRYIYQLCFWVACAFFIGLDLMTHEVPPCNNLKSHSTSFSLTSSSQMSPKEKQPKDHSYISEEICFTFEVVSSLCYLVPFDILRYFLELFPYIVLEIYVYIVHIERENVSKGQALWEKLLYVL